MSTWLVPLLIVLFIAVGWLSSWVVTGGPSRRREAQGKAAERPSAAMGVVVLCLAAVALVVGIYLQIQI